MPLKYIEMDDWGVALWLRKPILYGMDDLLTFPDFGSLENELWIHSQIKDIQAMSIILFISHQQKGSLYPTDLFSSWILSFTHESVGYSEP